MPILSIISVKKMSTAVRVHEDAWRKAIGKANLDSYTKYGLYTTRILAVKHP